MKLTSRSCKHLPILALTLITAACSGDDKDALESDGSVTADATHQPDVTHQPDATQQIDATQQTDASAPALADVFGFFKDSVFQYVIKDGTSSVKTTRMTWTVTSYDKATSVARIKRELDPSTTKVPLPASFYLRKSTNGGLEYSSNGSSWQGLTSPGPGSSKINFLFCVKAAKPSSLLGSVSNGIKATSVTYPGGSAPGYQVFSEYNSSGNDKYFYKDSGTESYAKQFGFVKALCSISDQSSYPPFTSRREIDMIAYRIVMPDGKILEGGAQKPKAPSNLKATYKKRVSSWNPSTGTYEKRSYMSLSWSDNSSNETKFNIYLKATDGKWYTIDKFKLNNGATFTPTTFPPNEFSDTIRAGYYVNWDPGTYSFRLTAASLDDESDPSNEASATAF